MKLHLISRLAFVALVWPAVAIGQNEIAAQRAPKNIILMIGDGMAAPQLTAGMIAKGDALNLEKFPVAAYIKTTASNDLITDSAAGGTAMASGVKTYNGAIGVGADSAHVETFLEIAESKNLATGLIATSSITHATPAAFYAHQVSRAFDEAIARDLVDSGVDLFMGGGRDFFAHRADGLNLLEALESRGYKIAGKPGDVKPGIGKAAVFIADKQPVKYLDGRGDFLPEATEKAIEVLDQSEHGFFLMVEGSQIDWGGHDGEADYVEAEMLDFDRAIGKAMDFAERDGNTLVIVTADHETGGMTIVRDKETQQIEIKFSTGGHTPLLVPLFAYGPGADGFGGLYENTEIFHRMVRAMGWKVNENKDENW